MNKLSKRLHKKLWSIHNWVGLYAGVAIAILSITGVAALFRFEIDEGLNYRKFNVEKLEHYADLKPVFDSLDTVYGIKNFMNLQFPKGEGKSWIRTYSINRSFWNSEVLNIFINPYTGEILGKRDYMKSISYFVRNVHVRLYEAVLGRQIVGIVGLALLISTITGFWIYGGFMKKQLFAAIRQKNLRIKMADYHKLIGVTTLLFNLMIAITGFWLGIQPKIPHQKPGSFKMKESPITKEEDMHYEVDYLEVLEKSKELFPELEVSTIFSSNNGNRTIKIVGNVVGTAYERNKFSLILDKECLTEIYRYDIREASKGAKVYLIQESLHFGDWGGIWMKIMYAFFGITSGFLSLTGFIVYLKRTEKKRKQKPSFIELKPLLIKWVLGILAALVLIAILNAIFGVVIPSLLVIGLTYGTLLYLILKALYLYIKRLIISRNAKQTS